MIQKYYFSLGAGALLAALLAALVLAGCPAVFTVIDEREYPIIAGKTFTVDSADNEPADENHISWQTATAEIKIYESGTVNSYVIRHSNYALLAALLTGLGTGDTVTFDEKAKISAFTLEAAATVDSGIAIGAYLPATAFAPAVSLTGNATNGFTIIGDLTGSVLKFEVATGTSTYNGVKLTPDTGAIDVTPSSGTAITLKTGDASNVVEVASGSTITGLTIDVASTLPTAGFAVNATGVTVTTTIATTVDVTGLGAGGSDTVILDKSNTAAITIDGVSITPDGSASNDITVTKASGTKLDLTTGNSGDTVAIASSTTYDVAISHGLTAISTDGSKDIYVNTAASGITITAAAVLTVDISGLAVSDDVLLTGNFAFTVNTGTSSTPYAYTAGTGVMTGGGTPGDRNYLLEDTSVGSTSYPAAGVVGGAASTTSFGTVTPTSGGASDVVAISRTTDT
jgi:hypothetical protein